MQVGKDGKPIDWRAAVLVGGGVAYIYARDPNDGAVRESVLALFAEQSKRPGSGIARVIAADEVRALGGDPAALLAIEAEPGTYFGNGYTAYDTTPPYVGMHGYDPNRPEMKASLLLLAPSIQPGTCPARA